MKDKILKVASREFAKYGYKGVSLDRIAQKIGVTKPALYYYFKNKQTLYETILENKMDTLIKDLKICLNEKPEDGIKCYIETFEETFKKHPCFASILARELVNGGENVSDKIIEKFANILKILASILNRGKEEGVFKFYSPFSIQIMIVGSLLIERSTEGLRNRISNFLNIDGVEDFALSLEEKILKAIKK